MKTKFFTNKEGTVRGLGGMFNSGRDKFFLRPHAREEFWRWIASWAKAARRPADVGFDVGGDIPGTFVLIELYDSGRLRNKVFGETGNGRLYGYGIHITTFLNSYSRISLAPSLLRSGISLMASSFLTAAFTEYP